ncbi:MAG: hypothetical protein HFJ67_08170 [Adlercreutzia mucosicola]|nr:hypothetical protein [Adlercreutzia mucosicola]
MRSKTAGREKLEKQPGEPNQSFVTEKVVSGTSTMAAPSFRFELWLACGKNYGRAAD